MSHSTWQKFIYHFTYLYSVANRTCLNMKLFTYTAPQLHPPLKKKANVYYHFQSVRARLYLQRAKILNLEEVVL